MKGSAANLATWVIALVLALLITWSAHQHHMPVLQTLTIGLAVAYAVKGGAENLIRAVAAARNGAAR